MNESTLVPRQEMIYLDWLVHNVHKWPDDKKFICYSMDDGCAIFHEHNKNCATWYTKDQWLSRRAELQNKPSWKDAPEWAKYLVQNSIGLWSFTRYEPHANTAGGWSMERDIPYRDNRVCVNINDETGGEVLGDWRDTLEKRPDANEIPARSNQPKPSADIPECAEVKEFEPFVSVEDAVREFDAAYHASKPGDAATAKQPEPKGSGNPILGMVLADLANRALEGKEKYGEPLLAHNGRNPLWDAYQEALDLAMYLRQAIEEQK